MASVRIKDIAKKCNVSEGTVDRALNNRGGIKEETKELVLRVAKEMNYKPNHLARCLAKGKTYTIGVMSINLSNTFFSILIEAIEAEARKHGYFIDLILTHNDKKREIEALNHFALRKVDGIIMFPVGVKEELEDLIKSINIPIVSVYNRLICKEIPHIDVDCRKIMRNAVKMLRDKGYEEIWYLDNGTQRLKEMKINTFSFEQRRCGYEEGISLYGYEEPRILTKFDEEKLLEIAKKDKKTAVMCFCDNVAIKVLNLYMRNGIKVPKDVGIMGFDNIEMLNRISPRICSVDCQIRTIGEKTFDMLLAKMNNEKDIHDIVIDYSFTEGETL